MINFDIRHCDNLDLLKSQEAESIDLIYCDVLYGTGNNFGDYKDLKPVKEIIEEHYVPRIKEMKRVLKDTGSIYLQMDMRISHWIRCIVDDLGFIFKNQVIWHYGLGNNNTKRNWQTKHDVIIFATKTNNYTWNEMRGEITPQMKKNYRYKDDVGFYIILKGKNTI